VLKAERYDATRDKMLTRIDRLIPSATPGEILQLAEALATIERRKQARTRPDRAAPSRGERLRIPAGRLANGATEATD
jgi:hypothetical protein